MSIINAVRNAQSGRKALPHTVYTILPIKCLPSSLDYIVFLLRRRPATGDFYPFSKAATLLSLDVDNVRITFASAANAVLLFRVPRVPVLVFFSPLLLILGCHLQELWPFQLSGDSISWAVLDGRMPISKVTEVMDIFGAEQSACSERMNRGISPLRSSVICSSLAC